MNKIRFIALIIATFILAPEAFAAKWSRHYIDALPDSAFAAIEYDVNGRKLRHLPHHNASGEIDKAHLKAALRMWKRVHWAHPENAQKAFEHLRQDAYGFSQKGTRH